MTHASASRPLRGPLCNTVLAAGVNGVRMGRGPHLEPGVVRYENEDGSFITYLLTREAIERGRPSAAGCPVVGRSGGYDHVKVKEEDKNSGKFDGAAAESYAGPEGYEYLLFQLKDRDTGDKIDKGSHQFSCAYYPTEVADEPGVWHNVPYDAVIKNLAYTHFAVVPNPRYDAAQDGHRIEMLNTQPAAPGGRMNPMTKILKSLLAAVPLAQLEEVVNGLKGDKQAALAAKQTAAKAAAKTAYDAELANAGEDATKKAAAKTAFEAANAAAEAMKDEDAPAESAEEKAKREKKERLATLRNEASALAKELGEDPLGGDSTPAEPGLGAAPITAAPAGAPSETPEQKAAREQKEAAGAERANAAAAWPLYAVGLVEEAVAVKVLLNTATKKILPYDAQPEEVRNAWGAVVKAAPGASPAEKAAHLRAKARAVTELANARRGRVEAQARKDAEREQRFNDLKTLAEERGSTDGVPATGLVTVREKAALGQARYGSRQ